MRFHLVLSILLISTAQSCISSKALQKVGYPFKNKKVILKVPKGYTFTAFSGGEEPMTFEYLYNDSSVIYITTDENGGLNSSNISKQKDGFSKLFNVSFSHDSLLLQGVDENKLNWKYSFLGKYGIGYLKVSDKIKSEFDRILNNVKVR
jgi:hypothetical protein